MTPHTQTFYILPNLSFVIPDNHKYHSGTMLIMEIAVIDFHFAENIHQGTHLVTQYNPGMFGNHHIIICSPLKIKCCIIRCPQKEPPYNICKIWCQYFGEDYLILRKKINFHIDLIYYSWCHNQHCLAPPRCRTTHVLSPK